MMTLEEIKRTTIDNIADTEIRKSDIHGYGLFALRDFRAGETICALDGQVMPWSKYEELENELKSKLGELSDYFFMEWNCLRKDALLVRPLRTKYSYINHSREGRNLKLKRIRDGCILIFVEEDVAEGEELLLNYNYEPLSDDYIRNNEFLKN